MQYKCDCAIDNDECDFTLVVERGGGIRYMSKLPSVIVFF